MDLTDELTEPFGRKPKANIYTSPTVLGFFFEKHPTLPDRWICKNCKVAKKCITKQSYTNLRSHCGSCYGADYEGLITQHLIDTKQVIGVNGKITRTLLTGDSGFRRYTQRMRDCYKWLKVIIMNNFPLTTCENEHMRELAGDVANTFSSKTLRKYILCLVLLVEKEIAKELDNKLICAMFDGWEHRRRKYIGLFASYEGDHNNDYEELLLAIQPTLEADENGTAQAHVDLIRNTLELYEIDIDKQLVCLGADK